jgi:pilus assembly protein TadC
MFGGGAGSIADMISRMKEIPNVKKHIKNYREFAKSYKHGKKRLDRKEITLEELEQIRLELKPYIIHQRNTIILFALLFIPIVGILIWEIFKLLSITI